MVRALAFHQCGLGSIPRLAIICGLSFLLVLVLAVRVFSPNTPVFPSPLKPTFPNSNLESKGYRSVGHYRLFSVTLVKQSWLIALCMFIVLRLFVQQSVSWRDLKCFGLPSLLMALCFTCTYLLQDFCGEKKWVSRAESLWATNCGQRAWGLWCGTALHQVKSLPVILCPIHQLTMAKNKTRSSFLLMTH